LTADATYGAAATAWNTKVDSANAYTGAANVAIGSTVSQGTAFTLTTGVETRVGTSGGDTFDASPAAAGGQTFTSLDNLDGGAGTDTLSIAAGGAYTTPVGVTVKSIEIINLANSTGGTTFNTTAASGFTGVTNLNVTNAAGASAITAAGTTDVTLSSVLTGAQTTSVLGGSSVGVTITGGAAATGADRDLTIGSAAAAPTGAVTASFTSNLDSNAGAVAGGAIAITGGTSVTVSQLATSTRATVAANTNASTLGAVGVTGSAATTAVTVNQSAAVAATTNSAAVAAVANTNGLVAARTNITNSAVTIADLNAGSTTIPGTIASVTLQNYGNSTISSSGLTALNLSATSTTGVASGTLGLTSGLTTGNPTTLALNLGGGSLGVITDNSNKFTTVNAALTANTTLGGFADTALRTVNLSGTGVLTLSAVNTAITAITETGAAGLNADVSGVTGLTAIDASGTTGANTLTLAAAAQTFTGGAGNDVITITADATKVITGGGGTNTLVLNANATTFTAANTVAKVTGFTTLGTAGASQGTYDLSVLTGFNAIDVRATEAAALVFNKVAAGTTLQLGAATNAVTYKLAGTSGATGTVAVNLKGTTVTAANGGGTAGFTTTALTLNDQNGVGVGNVTINSDASVFQGLHTITTLTDSALSNLAITGTGSLTITNAATTSSTLTISDNSTGTSATANGIGTLTSTGDVLGSINYSGTHAYTIGTLTDNVVNATITNANTGTTGVLTIGGHTAAALASLTLNGSVALTGTYALNGAATVSGATNNSAVSLTMSGGGIKTITLGNGANIIVTGAAADVITVGTGANDINPGAGADRITVGAGTGADTLRIKAAAGAAGADSGTFAVPGTNTISTTAMDIVTGFKAADKIQLLATAYTGAAGAAAGLIANGTAANTLVGLTLIDNGAVIVRGTYDNTAKTFVGSATGTDSIFVYDSDATLTSTAYESVVLVGYVANSVTGIGGATGLITLA